VVIVITGPIASGKTTVARALFHELAEIGLQAAVIDLDILEDMLTADGPKAEAERWARARRAAGRLASGFLSDGLGVVIADGSYNGVTDREDFEQHLGFDVRPVYVTLTVSFEEALRRAQGDPTRGLSRDPAFLGPYFSAAAAGAANRPPADVVIDTESASAATIAAQLAPIVRSIVEGQ
jgi:hypothetical protein